MDSKQDNVLDSKSFILIDLRVPDEDSIQFGFLPMSVVLDRSEFEDPYVTIPLK